MLFFPNSNLCSIENLESAVESAQVLSTALYNKQPTLHPSLTFGAVLESPPASPSLTPEGTLTEDDVLRDTHVDDSAGDSAFDALIDVNGNETRSPSVVSSQQPSLLSSSQGSQSRYLFECLAAQNKKIEELTALLIQQTKVILTSLFVFFLYDFLVCFCKDPIIEFRGQRYPKSKVMSVILGNNSINVAFNDFVIIFWEAKDYTNKNLTGRKGKPNSTREAVDNTLFLETLGELYFLIGYLTV